MNGLINIVFSLSSKSLKAYNMRMSSGLSLKDILTLTTLPVEMNGGKRISNRFFDECSIADDSFFIFSSKN
jgi:hypothetical protein